MNQLYAPSIANLHRKVNRGQKEKDEFVVLLKNDGLFRQKCQGSFPFKRKKFFGTISFQKIYIFDCILGEGYGMMMLIWKNKS